MPWNIDQNLKRVNFLIIMTTNEQHVICHALHVGLLVGAVLRELNSVFRFPLHPRSTLWCGLLYIDFKDPNRDKHVATCDMSKNA